VRELAATAVSAQEAQGAAGAQSHPPEEARRRGLSIQAEAGAEQGGERFLDPTQASDAA